MSSKAEKDKTKQLQDKCQSVLNALLRDEDNKYCVDCDSKGPRWASWNLGVFLCIRCAGIHRNLGVHISKVKSVNLDSWTPEQVVSLQQMGNSRARAVYEANLPDNFRRPQNDSTLESFIRAKYEHKKYIAREWVPPSLPEVNWEKEIDEEIERQKRKKKTVIERKSLGAVEVPQLPKPKNASPKPGRVQVQAVVPPPAAENKLNADLLGLQNGDDSFSNFLSAPVPSASNNASTEKKPEEKPVDPAISEEESFFNQTAPTEKEKVKLTKDSILALYGTAPPVNNFNTGYNTAPQTQVPFNAGFPMQQQNFQNFGSFPQQNYPQMQNGGMPQQFPTNAQFPAQFQNQYGVNQFAAMPMQNMPSSNNIQQFPNQFQSAPLMQNQMAPQISNQFPVNQFPQQGSFSAQQPNPFFNQTSLPQQFGNMSLNGQKGTPAPPTVATNIWQ